MARHMDEELRYLHRDVASRQYYQKNPQPIAEMVSRLLARQGYAQVESSSQREDAWNRAVGGPLAQQSRVGTVRRGVLEIVASNSAVIQELTFRKKRLLKEMTTALPDQKIRELRFRVGEVD